MNKAELLFTLLRVGLDFEPPDCLIDLRLSSEEWSCLLLTANEHGVVGIVFSAMQRLPKDCWPDMDTILEWISAAELIKRRNITLNEQCTKVCRMLEASGLDCCILKGQGMASLYPTPLLRQSGDIDVWVKAPSSDCGNNINRSVREIKKCLSSIELGKIGKAVYHHIEWTQPDAEVEVHYRPQAFNNPFTNRRFQQWCYRMSAECMVQTSAEGKEHSAELGYNVPTAKFNRIYILVHMYHHLLFEGLALKQVCDYAVLLSRDDELSIRNEEFQELFHSFGMLRFVRGMMWIMGHVFHIGRDRMIVEPDEKEGRFILHEIMEGMERIYTKTNTKTKTTSKAKTEADRGKESVAAKFWRRTIYRFRFISHYPSEILWDVPFRLYHFFWRMRWT